PPTFHIIRLLVLPLLPPRPPRSTLFPYTTLFRSIQAEIASDPIHYKDAKGKWQNIDPTVTTTDESGYAFGNKKNNFHTFFGKKAEKLLKFRMYKHLIQLGVGRAEDKNLSPVVKDNTVTYSGLFPDADVKYTITSKSLKEDIILKKAPDNPVFTFTLKMGGV